MKKIKAITFDFGGTLAYGKFDKKSFSHNLINYFFSQSFSGGKSELNKARKGMLKRLQRAQNLNRELRFEDLYRGLLFDFDLHPTKERLDYIEQLYYRFFRVDFFPGIKEMLSDLSAKYNLAVISNVISNISSLALQKFDLLRFFDHIVLSRDLGIRKPDPEIFNFVLQSWGIDSIEAIHVGDSLEHDIQGAKDVGMQTVWIKGNDDIKEIRPDFVISKITDLPSLL